MRAQAENMGSRGLDVTLKQAVLRRQEKGLRLQEPVLCHEGADLGRVDGFSGLLVQDTDHCVGAREPSVASRDHDGEDLVASERFLAQEGPGLRQATHDRHQADEDPRDEGEALDDEDRVLMLIVSVLSRGHQDLSRLSPAVSHLSQARVPESHVLVQSAEALDPSAEDRNLEKEERSKKKQSA